MKRLALLAVALVASNGCLGRYPSNLVQHGSGGSTERIAVRADSVTTTNGRRVYARLQIANISERPFVLVPEDITLVDKAGNTVHAAHGAAPERDLPMAAKIIVRPLEFVIGLALLPVTVPIALVTELLSLPSEEKEEESKRPYWIFQPQSRTEIRVHFQRQSDRVELAAIHIRDLSTGETIEIPFGKRPGSDTLVVPPYHVETDQ